ncbi:MAG: NRDE family protein [Leptospiraceae bacterium]|nr:NRDE family protein [Leptospiraceae bacterium]
MDESSAMCLISFSYKFPEGNHFVLAANRDEFYDRKTLAANSWEEDPRVWGGRDLQNGGAWLGVRVDGRFAFLTNYRDFRLKPLASPISRGHLVRDFLLSEDSPKAFIESRITNSSSYEGFNLIVGNHTSAHYWNNIKKLEHELAPGIYSVSNGILDEPWPKLQKAKSRFSSLIESSDKNQFDPNQFFNYLQDKTQAEEDKLPDTGIPRDKEKALSSIFIELPGYGTRSSTFVSFPQNGRVIREERVWIP